MIVIISTLTVGVIHHSLTFLLHMQNEYDILHKVMKPHALIGNMVHEFVPSEFVHQINQSNASSIKSPSVNDDWNLGVSLLVLSDLYKR